MKDEFVTNEIAAAVLGKAVQASRQYNPAILVAVPREENRKRYNINPENLPFEGYDIWQCYEFSALTKNNLPVTRVLKLRYSCVSSCIIESKSLKLYLNSFNMSCFGNSPEECLDICKGLISKDLSKKLQTEVEVNFIDPEISPTNIFKEFENISKYINYNTLNIHEFKESPQLIKTICTDVIKEHYLVFDSLRSNCRVTHQPDFGTLFVYYKSKKVFDYNSLVEYFVSFRCEYHFHEECCEMIYKRLFDLLDNGDDLFVGALYTRRGGIDISPLRCSKGLKIEDIKKLADINVFARYGINQ